MDKINHERLRKNAPARAGAVNHSFFRRKTGMMTDIFNKIDRNIPLTGEDALALLNIKNLSPDYYALLGKAMEISRRDFGDKGYLFAQLGLNIAPCSGNCVFCSLAQCNSTFTQVYEKPVEEILEEVEKIDFTRVTALFLMTTADFDPEKFLEIGRMVRARIPRQIALVANTGDFDLPYALRLKQAGFTGAYHIVRLREGVDTALPVETRVQSLDAIRDAGLRLYYCLEPIGPEHDYEEMVTEMLRAREYRVDVMAAMRRVSVEKTRFASRDMIDDFEFAKIAAVTRLVVMPKVSMNVHEPCITAMLAGVNQLYAELGVNPRDTSARTETGRGFGVDEVAAMLRAAGFRPCVEQ